MHRTLFVAVSLFALTACGMQGQDNPEQGEASSIATVDPSGDPGYETTATTIMLTAWLRTTMQARHPSIPIIQ